MASPRMRALVAVTLAGLLALPARAQFGQGDGSSAPGGAGEAGDILASRSTRRIRVVDNLFFGGGGIDEILAKYKSKGWDAKYHEDTYVNEFFRIAQDSDILYILTHAGVRASDQQVGFVWRTVFGINKNVLTADMVAERMRDKPKPALVVVAGCKTTENDSMARAFGGAYIGFAEEVNPVTAFTWCHQLLDKIADGSSYKAAFDSTPPIVSRLSISLGGSLEGGSARLIEPAPAE